MTLRIAYLDESKGGSTLLIAGDVSALDQLAAAMELLAAHDGERVDLNLLADVVSEYSVHAECADESIGLLRNGPDFLWIHDSATWAHYALQVRALLLRPPGHIYLGGPYSDIQAMVACGEDHGSRFA